MPSDVTRKVSFPDPQVTASPLSNSPPSSPGLGPQPAPISTGVHNPSDGYPRRRPVRQGTLQTLNDDGERRGTTDSTRSRGSRASRRNASVDPNASVLRRMTSGLFTPEKKIAPAPSYWQSIKAAIFSTWINVLLIFIPLGWILYLVRHKGGVDSISDTVIFIMNFIAIIPLAGLLGFATEEAAMRLGQTMGGLLNATLGNAVELIVAILALIKCELAVVQSSLIGSILSNILLVLGMCFFAGGVKYAEQTVKSTAAQLNSSLLLIAVIAVLIPSAFHFSIKTSASGDGLALTYAEEGNDLLAMSHGVAILLLLLYVGYLLFQMWSHAHFYVDEESQSSRYPAEVTNVREKIQIRERLHNYGRRKKQDEETATSATTNGSVEGHPDAERSSASEEHEEEEEEEEEEVPQMNVVVTIILMVTVTVIVGVTAEFLVDSIEGVTEAHPALSQEWIGLILLPIVSNACEHWTAVSVSVKDKLDLSISVAVGSSIQIALFVIPVIELLAWCIGKPMTLLFDPYESIVLFLSVLIVNQTLSDGRSNWMEGLVLMFLYLIIAVSFWYYPGSNTATLVGCGS